MIKAVIFDMDGVLVDTEGFYNRRRIAYLRELGRTFDRAPDLTGYDEQSIWMHFEPNDAIRREQLRIGYRSYQKAHPAPYRELLNPDAQPVIAELSRRGYRCAIASSSYAELIGNLIDIAGIGQDLDCWLSGHQCGAFKPDPEIYERVMAMLDVTPPETLVIEDSPLGIEAGIRSGARVLALRQAANVTLDQSGADRVISSLREILHELPDQGMIETSYTSE